MPIHKPDKFYKKRIEIAYILSLIIIILLFVFSKRYHLQFKQDIRLKISPDFLVEDIPITRQGIPRKKPQRPDIIIPVEDDVVPEDEEIEDIDFSIFNGPDGPPGLPTGEGFSVEILPRPIAEVIPEFPHEDLKNKVEGVVKLHIFVNVQGKVEQARVVSNSTGSQRCANAAREAAFKNRFIPAKIKGKAVGMWIIKEYTFSAPK